MTAFDQRRQQDIEKLRQMERSSGGKIQVVRVSGNPVSEIELKLRYKTAPSKAYPASIADSASVKIQLSARYPFQEPAVAITSPILHPNVWSSGKVCLGTKWLPSQGLDLLAKRLIQIITFDPTVLNEKSPANADALAWYRTAKRQHPSAFPTDQASYEAPAPQQKMSWKTVETSDQKVVVTCPSCSAQLRLPAGRSGTVECPTCKNKFEATT